MRPCRVREALGAALALASSEGLEQCQKQSRSMFRFWSRHDRVPVARLSASAANRDRPLKMKPFIYQAVVESMLTMHEHADGAR